MTVRWGCALRALATAPFRVLSSARKLGAATHALCSAILAERPHPRQGSCSCLRMMRRAVKYGDARVENAVRRCVAAQMRSYRSVEYVLWAWMRRARRPDGVALHEHCVASGAGACEGAGEEEVVA